MQNEIDLLHFISLAGSRVRQNVVGLIVLLALSIAAGWAAFFLFPKQYETQLVGSSKYLKPETLEVAVRSLNRLLEEGNYEAVGNYLSLEPSHLTHVKSFSLYDIRPATFTPSAGREKQDEYERMYFFGLSMVSWQPVAHEPIQQGLLSFLENNEFVRARTEAYDETGRAQLDKINQEVERLNTLREKLYSGNENRSITVMDPSALNKTIVEIADQARTLELELKLNRPIQIIQGFIPYGSANFPRKRHAALGIALLWIVTSAIYLIYKK